MNVKGTFFVPFLFIICGLLYSERAVKTTEDSKDNSKEENKELIELTAEQKHAVFVGNTYDWVESMAFAIIVVVIIFTFIVRVVGVNGESMLPTLENGDSVLISNLFYTPKGGDIAVITPTVRLDVPIIKRVIATEGQTVDIDFTTGEVTVDGQVLSEPYIAEPTTIERDITFPQTVPQGYLFVMGDNRNNSLDSRDSSIGMVDKRYILGKTLMIVKPITKIGFVK